MALPTLTLDEVCARLGEREIDKGRPYAAGGAVTAPRRQGTTLKAQCQGTASRPYHVTVTLAPRGIASSACSCPVGGECKHVAALLLRYLEDPQSFLEVEKTRASLERRSKDELVALVEAMLERQPELERLLELPRPGEAIDPKRLEAQVRGILQGLSHSDWDYGDDSLTQAGLELTQLVAAADARLAQNQPGEATFVYETIAEAVTAACEEIPDEDGELSEVVRRCNEGLASVLAATGDAALRERALRALFAVYLRDLRLGGIGLGDEVPELVLHYASPQERERVTTWLREALPSGNGFGERFRRQAIGKFLLELHGGLAGLDDETFLRLCRESGRVGDLVARLLLLGRAEEALREAADAPDHELLGLAELFVQHGQGRALEPIIERRAAHRDGDRVGAWQGRFMAWLRDRAREEGDHARALELSETLFWQSPRLEAYRDLRRDAEGAGRWRTLRIGLLKRLERERQHALLTEIHLDENDPAAALRSVQGSRGSGLALRVAAAAEATHPAEAAALFEREIDRLVEFRGRKNYRQAAQLLLRLRPLYARLGRDWQDYLSQLKDRHRRLRALHEELGRAGL